MVCKISRILIDPDKIYIAEQLLDLKPPILQELVIG